MFAPPKPASSHTALTGNLCKYCYERPVALVLEWRDSCIECVFECANCRKVTPYERGVSWDDYCDDCGVKLGSTPF